MSRVLVTGGAGFIGSHYVRHLLDHDDVEKITVLDALTYAGHAGNLGAAMLSPRLRLVPGDIGDTALVDELVADHDEIVHLAAESHVDHSFTQAARFISTNVAGTQTVLEAARRHGIAKVVHVSTDEVYGPVLDGAASEDAPLAPTVPYAASKAAGDLIALSYFSTHGVPVCVTRSSNNYGPHQHPEKIIPAHITALLHGAEIVLHGDGQHVRNWLHVADNCAALELVRRHGVPGQVYNVGGGVDLTNEALTGLILDEMGAGWDRVIRVPDRCCNDRRYAMTWDKIARLGYRPQRGIADGLAETIAWYRTNADRWAPMLAARTGFGVHR
ncbi:dTDP-glucose 4,6-dehydratase [Nocardia puris]|uniref:dTDP-glucose 4,6-dehydratase n=1 Tax=Nocardia puris TaxID=208602 RepID=UPI001893F0A0|nr:dTDP-glucose 4,6-dehydratase [Nocardia puris]MBF6214747.1 dTDP-glucose 4,6-dehydratase [Nocardia puris]MBF6368779.1 dTDP-glucose 4,6-dehydratase [Nocardia puris]MBF6462359.1 dTDP-glucose 4,6-dehydratase [Nocardia puris]